MSQWKSLDVEAKITEVLRQIRYHKPHHFKRPYLTAYQLAIAFAERYPAEFKALNYPIGGKGIGQRTSLAQYLSRELSRRIKNKSITHIEGAFVSKTFEAELRFRTTRGRSIRSSVTNVYDLSMFRLAD